jgi:MFS family permease
LTQRGFTEAHLALLIFLRPIIAIPSAIVFGHLTDKIGARRMCAVNGFLALIGLLAAPMLSGLWQLFPIILSGYAAGIYGFVMVGILNHAPPGKNQDYLCAYYLVIMLPGLTPIALAKIVESGAPVPALGIAAILCLLATIVLAASARGEKSAAKTKAGAGPVFESADR